MQDTKPSDTRPFAYTLDERQFLISPSGAKLARVDKQGIWLYDKRLRQEWLLPVEQLLEFISAMVEL